MKTIVLDRDTLEFEIKPHAALDEYLEQTAQDVQAHLVRGKALIACPCPGCGAERSREAFEKFGLTYRECEACHSLYVSPRPSEAALTAFYRNAPSSRFWRERVLKETAEARREKIFRPRARWLLDAVDQYRPQAQLAIVVGYHNDLLVKALSQRGAAFRFVVTNPIADVEYAGVDLPELFVSPTPLAMLADLGPADLILAFDILDRHADLNGFFEVAKATLAPGGLLLASTTLSSGFDLQVLWDRSRNIYPPERLNLLSVEGLTALYERHGFDALEFSTPGIFDIEIVQRAVQGEPQGGWSRFIRYLVEHRGEDALDAFQQFLQHYRLSSFARVVLRKSGETSC